MKQDSETDQRIELHNSEVASVMKMLHAIDLLVPNHSQECLGDMCKIDAIKALIAGRATHIQQEMGALVLAEDLLQTMPDLIIPLAMVYQMDKRNKQEGI